MPPDPTVAILEFQCRRPPDQEGDPLVIAGDDLPEKVADGRASPEIMLLREQLVEAELLGRGDGLDEQCWWQLWGRRPDVVCE